MLGHFAEQSEFGLPTHPRQQQVVELGEHEGREDEGARGTLERLPGGPVQALVGIHRGEQPARVEQKHRRYYPAPTRFLLLEPLPRLFVHPLRERRIPARE